MYKNYKLLLFLGAATIFLYLRVGKYEEFSLQKSISACVIAKGKILKETTPTEARKVCEIEIKQRDEPEYHLDISLPGQHIS